MLSLPTRSTLFPYTTLFRSLDEAEDVDRLRALQRHRLEVGLLDEHEFALRHLPALHELLRLDLALVERAPALLLDRKSTRLNSSHRCISYAVFCLKKKKKKY